MRAQSYINGRRIKLLREALHMTQRDLERLSGISQPHISQIEAGKVHAVGSGTLYALARALKTNMSYLAGTGSDPRPRSKTKLGDLPIDEAELLENYRNIAHPALREAIRRQAAAFGGIKED